MTSATSATSLAFKTFATSLMSSTFTQSVATCARFTATSLLVCLLATLFAGCGGAAPDAGTETTSAGPADVHHGEDDGHADEAGENAHTDADGHAARDSHDEHADAAATVIPAAIATASGIRVATVGPGTIADEHEVQGLLTPVEGRIAQVSARFPGPIRALRAGIGDRVRAGQALATIESNLSLSDYSVTSPIAGVVLQRMATVGGVAGEGMPLFEVADLSTLWVDLHIFGDDAGHITAGIPVTVTRMSDGVSAETTLERILPGTATASQSTVARASIANADGLWRPGAAVRARIVVDRADAAVVVPLTALQTDENGRDVVYLRTGDRYEERAVTLGRRDASGVEITAGLAAGTTVVTAQSFLVKADIGKSSAAHTH